MINNGNRLITTRDVEVDNVDCACWKYRFIQGNVYQNSKDDQYLPW